MFSSLSALSHGSVWHSCASLIAATYANNGLYTKTLLLLTVEQQALFIVRSHHRPASLCDAC